MADEVKLYVVTDGLPGPGAVSGEQRRSLIGKLRQQAVAVEQGAQVDGTTVELLRNAAYELERVSGQFVELETEDGCGTVASGVGWEGYPGKYSEEQQVHTLYRLGPFVPALRELTASGELVRAARAVDAMFSGGPRRWTLGGEEVEGDAADVLLILHDCLNDLEREAQEPATSFPVEGGSLTPLEQGLGNVVVELQALRGLLAEKLR